MYQLAIVIKRSKTPELLQANINRITRIALAEAALLWLQKYMKLHFLPSAVQRYSLTARRARYNAIKAKAMFVKDWLTKQRMPRPKPGAPLVWTGAMRDKLLNRAPQDFNLRIAATSKKQTVRVPLPTPHPLNPKNASEPGRLIKEEIVAMQKVATAAYKRELDSLKGYSVKRIQP